MKLRSIVMTLRAFCAISLPLLAVILSSPAHAGFLGNTVSADYHFPDLGTVLYPSGNAVVGAGTEFPNVGGFGVGISPSVDISDTNILISYPVGFTFSSPPTKTFDGWVISDILGAIPNIIGVSLLGTNIPGYDASQLSFDSDHVYINQLNFASFAANAFISVDVQFDSDGDGVPDTADTCPATALGALVDTNGCSGEQLVDLACPCDGDWRNHGQYVSCVAHAADDQVAAELLTQAQKEALVSARANSCRER